MTMQYGTDNKTYPQVLLRAEAQSARSKGDIVYLSMDEGGWIDDTPADDTDVHFMGVCAQDIASGEDGLYVIQGEVQATGPSAAYTAGQGLIMYDGAPKQSGGAFTHDMGEAVNDFGVIKVGGTTVTEITVVLVGFPRTATT